MARGVCLRFVAAEDWGGRVVFDPARRDGPGLGYRFVICRKEAIIDLLPGFMRNNDQWPLFWNVP